MLEILFPRYNPRFPDRYALEPATPKERFVAQLIDGLILGFFCGLWLWVTSGGKAWSIWIAPAIPQFLLEVQPEYQPGPLAFWLGGLHWDWTLPYGKVLHVGWPVPFFYFVYALYYAGFLSRYGQTPGKRIKRLVVLTDRGALPGFWQALLRWVGYFLAVLPLGAGIWPGLFPARRKMLQDHLARTTVYHYHP